MTKGKELRESFNKEVLEVRESDRFRDVEKRAVALLEKNGGRGRFDLEHTLAASDWVAYLCSQTGRDFGILGPAALLHDIGYSELFTDTDSTDYSKVMDRKKEHMVRGAVMSRRVLNEIDSYPPEEVERVSNLIEVHDDIPLIIERRDDELTLLAMADSLGAIDADVETTFTGKGLRRYVKKSLLGKRRRLFEIGLDGCFLELFDSQAKDFIRRSGMNPDDFYQEDVNQ